ncbi:GMC family oxidoreductase [Oscillatoria sp. FACHB-1407]|uniref:GMC oxidoreductase n=1 Tax=Oscillatoria sp. FACHB-1407 TaxID=2692847 RepID=UPI001682C8D3|nr:GMC family oxidoreductase [Oscillatoria sp. FACHB-1407]MBD2461560.1 GMC family oxidoreductase [Oscillatoria sp. FACHB-1407]
MIIDAHTLAAGETVETDVCIVGSGPAGLALAVELAGQNFRVALLESGGLEEPNAATQDLSKGKTAPGYPDLDITYNRRFAGTSNIWHIQVGEGEMGARFVPFNETDFEERADIPYSGWCITRQDLDPFYERAQSICKLGPYNYEPDYWKDANTPTLEFKSDRIKTIVCQFTRLNKFIPENRAVVEQASNITAYLHATVVEIETNDTAEAVTRLRVASAPGKEFGVVAKLFILATGGIEVPRLLLASNRVQKEGLGNQHDLVGRFFMDHPCYLGGLWYPASPQLFNTTSFYDIRRVKGTPIMARLVLAEEVVRKEGIMNVFGFLHPRTAGYRSRVLQSLRTLTQSLRKGKLPKQAGRHLGTVLGGVGDIISITWKRLQQPKVDLTRADKGGWSSLPQKDKVFTCFEMFLSAEQVPDPEKRITLMDERDALGRPRVKLDWNWKHPIDIHTIKRAQDIFKEEIEKAGLGRLDVIRDDNDLPYMTAASAHHLMGTTRMHPDPKQGVVDENCRVHGVSNLFIASSAVFPTGGQVNPTLTIVAMSIRLADHIKAVMASQMVGAER